jgi:heterodisulfide reductase subunit C
MTVDQVSAPVARAPGLRFLREVSEATVGHSRLEMCIQCGTCGGSCPSASAMDHTPRQLFAMIRAGMRDEVLKSNTPWMCVSCYHCYVWCPQDVHITDVMYTLKGMAEREGHRNPTAAGFSKIFAWNVEHFGRSWEIGLTARHYARHFMTRMPSIAPMGLGLMRRGRVGLLPSRIENRRQLRAILARAKELDQAGNQPPAKAEAPR